MKGVPIDESLCAYLKEYRRGQENAASSKELEAAFHVGGTELRRAVNRLRCDSTPFAAPMQATSMRRGDQRSGPPSPSSPGASLKSPRQQRACCNLMRKRRDRAWRKNWTPL